VHSTHGTLIESEAHTRRDVLKGSTVSLDHIITWNLAPMNTVVTCTMQAQRAKFTGWVQNADHAIISCSRWKFEYVLETGISKAKCETQKAKS